MMLTAKEAREKAQRSQVHTMKFVEYLEAEIDKRAAQGLFEYRYSQGCPQDTTKSGDTSIESYMSFRTPEAWQRVMDVLKAHPRSYGVSVVGDEPYVPRAFEDDDNPRKFISYYLKITW